MEKNGVIFKSKQIYDSQIGRWMQDYAAGKGFKLAPESMRILAAYLGTNLGLVESELEKIFLYLNGDNSEPITPAIVYEMINIDKDYNIFELMNSLGERDHSKSHFIVNQMMRNVKDNPPILIVFQLFQFFSKLLRVQSKKLRSEGEIAAELGLPNFVARQYAVAARTYNNRDLCRNLTYVLEADLFLKGIQGTHMSDEHVMKTLVYKLLN
jgi:DNA polymerase-3 subunit delta